MLRSPEVLAALADAALPRLLPRSVAALPTRVTDKFQQALIEGADGAAWTVRLSRSPAAGAAAEQADAFARLLTKRVPFAVPTAEGRMTLADRNLVTVQPRLPGDPMVWRGLTAGSAEATGVGRALAALHDVDPRVADEVGAPSYDADGYRSRRLAVLDRAAGTGLVPAALLARWERALEEVSLWRFPTCVTHGPLEGHDVFWNGHVSAISSWENASVSDPADDFAALWVLAAPEAFDTVLETYSAARSEAPDKHLERRIRLSAELQRVTVLLDAVTADDEDLIDRRTAALRRLGEQTVDDESLMPAAPRVRVSAAQPSDADEPIDDAEDDTTDTDDGRDDDAIDDEIDGADDARDDADDEYDLDADDTIELKVDRSDRRDQ
ncbi:phosphotransferase [Calidifontibacter indicus]|uniref:phosphotransferase n=1 Tax=Calidifontibacter indicus TaxID=419650 RepID=UPI003D717B46